MLMTIEESWALLGDDADILVAAGLLAADGSLEATIEVDAATDRLRQLLSPGALWKVVRLAPDDIRMPAWQRLGPVPRWEMPKIERTDALGSTVRQAWRAALPAPVPQWGRAVLRVQVTRDADAQLLQSVDQVGPYLLVPVCGTRHPDFFSWRWPVRVAVASGPHADELMGQLKNSAWHAALFEAVIAQSADEKHDLLLVGAGTAEPSGRRRARSSSILREIPRSCFPSDAAAREAR